MKFFTTKKLLKLSIVSSLLYFGFKDNFNSIIARTALMEFVFPKRLLKTENLIFSPKIESISPGESMDLNELKEIQGFCKKMSPLLKTKQQIEISNQLDRKKKTKIFIYI